MKGMHSCITAIIDEIKKTEQVTIDDFIAIVDGNYFTPVSYTHLRAHET